jgi:6-phosphogluconolactonase/glucosamine-6-phosphate isomerase/deaminase
MGGGCGTHGEQDSCIQDFGGKKWKKDTTCKVFGVDERILQGDQKVSVHLMITMPHYLPQSDCLAADRQGQGSTRLTLTPSVIPNSNYVIMVSD